jgi:hypothetical protein
MGLHKHVGECTALRAPNSRTGGIGISSRIDTSQSGSRLDALLALSMLMRIELAGTFCAGESGMADTVSDALSRSSEGTIAR